MLKRLKEFFMGRPVQSDFLAPISKTITDPSPTAEKVAIQHQVGMQYRMIAASILDPRNDDWTIADQPGIDRQKGQASKDHFFKTREKYARV